MKISTSILSIIILISIIFNISNCQINEIQNDQNDQNVPKELEDKPIICPRNSINQIAIPYNFTMNVDQISSFVVKDFQPIYLYGGSCNVTSSSNIEVYTIYGGDSNLNSIYFGLTLHGKLHFVDENNKDITKYATNFSITKTSTYYLLKIINSKK